MVWATMWERAANIHYVALMGGIPELPLGWEYQADIASGAFAQRMRSESWEWKRAALHHRYQGRPLVWVDDQAPTWLANPRGEPWRDGPTAG